MHIKRIRIENFRNLKDVDITLHPQLNFFCGDNGAGKTSLLEALVVLSRGRSFKTSQTEELSGIDDGSFRIFLEAQSSGRTHRLGLERSGTHWKARQDGKDLALLSDLTRQLPLVLMEPNSHLLVSGSAEYRRRFLDWGVFHVEQGFLDVWRRYARAIKQRNAALREGQLEVLDSLDELAGQLGEKLDALRSTYFEQFLRTFDDHQIGGAPELRKIRLRYDPGWKGASLHQALQKARKQDLERGATGFGPHRADIVLLKEEKSVRTLLSRGEQKGLAANLLLTQARLLASKGENPLVLLDDLASEFDKSHVGAVLQSALECAGQIWATGTETPLSKSPHKLFHVEHGAVQEMV